MNALIYEQCAIFTTTDQYNRSSLQPQLQFYKDVRGRSEMIIQQQARIKKQEQEIQVRLIL